MSAGSVLREHLSGSFAPAERTLPVMLVPPMALSRVLLGVHYPSDVAAGVAVGAAVAGVAAWADGHWQERANE